MNSAPKYVTHDNSSKSRDANRRVRWWGYCLYKKHRKQKDRKKHRKSKDRKKQKNRKIQRNRKKHVKQRDWKKHGETKE